MPDATVNGEAGFHPWYDEGISPGFKPHDQHPMAPMFEQYQDDPRFAALRAYHVPREDDFSVLSTR